MAKGCSSTQYWDSVVQECQPCHLACKQQPSIDRCKKFCVISQCHERSGHFYDGVLQKCARCAEVCSGQNTACPRQCLKTTPAATGRVTTTPVQRLPPVGILARSSLESRETTPAVAASGRVTTTPVQTLPPVGIWARSSLDSSILVYSLWALSVVLVFSSLGLAFRVFLRESRSGSAKTGLKNSQGILNKDLGLPLEEEQFGCGPADSSTPTENCVCVHCFPDLRGLAPDNPIRESWSNREVELQRVQDGETEWTHWAIYSSESNAAHKGPV